MKSELKYFSNFQKEYQNYFGISLNFIGGKNPGCQIQKNALKIEGTKMESP